jgi:Pyruvate/2-oxoacid:ferredoxin oxidoreductase delta subunit
MDSDPCRLDLPEHSCISLGSAAEHVLSHGIGRPISKQDAINLVKEVAEKGAVHQVGRLVPLKDYKATRAVDVICNCCWDCCGVFGNYSRGNTPFLLKAYYVAEIADAAGCNDCGACEPYCPVEALHINDEGLAEIKAEMCCGCGLCASHCPENAIQLKPAERDVFLPVLAESERRIA